jgi:phosphate transport system permease protein
MEFRRIEEGVFKAIGFSCVFIVIVVLLLMVLTILGKGLPALSVEMVTAAPGSGFYLGGGGGVLNAIVGSLYLAAGATLLAFAISLPTAMFLQTEYFGRTKAAEMIRLTLDVLWGIPSIVYGAFGFMIMIWFGMRASLLGGIISLAFVIFPVTARAIDEALLLIPRDLKEVSYVLGATRLETMLSVTLRQAAPAIFTGVILAFGRAIGDAASILFTSGYTDKIPSSLFEPAASLPLAIFFQFNSPFKEVQERAYASAVILLALILLLTTLARVVGRLSERNIIR